MKKLVCTFILISFLTKAGNPPSIIFKENKGQWPEKVLFGAEFYNIKFYANKTSFNYCIYDPKDLGGFGIHSEKKKIIHGHNYEVNFVNADLTYVTKSNPQPEYYNYFLGNDKSKWASRVKAFGNLHFNNIYDNIDLKLYSNELNLKYDLIIKKGGDVSSIKINYEHTNGIELLNNEIIIKTSVGTIIEKEPFAYQLINGEKKIIKCKYTLTENNSVGFVFPDGYDKNYELVIDPVVVACSYSGTSVFSYNCSTTGDDYGNIYNAAGTDIGYPVTTGAFQVNYGGNGDIVINKFNSNGSLKIFATYIGGSQGDWPTEILVSNNEILFVGTTSSKNYPVSISAFDTILGGNGDIFITKLDITGSILIASTFIGGSSDEVVNQFAVSGGYPPIGIEVITDKQKNIFITSNTQSLDFPVTAGVISNSLQGSSDAVVFKIDSTLSNLLWSTYLGGTGMDGGVALRTDKYGGVYVLGTTNSLDFPTTSGTLFPSKIGPLYSDIFIAHLNPTATRIIASTYLGSNTVDIGNLMDVDEDFNVYLCGVVESSNFLIPTPGTYSNAYSINTIHKIDSSLSTLGFQTKFGTSIATPWLCYTLFKVDSCRNVYVGGTAYLGYPVTPDKFQSFGGGATDMYFAVFSPNCSSLRFASYYGGNAPPPSGYSSVGEQSSGISHVNSRGVMYMAIAASQNLPTTPGAFASSYSNTTTAVRIYNDAFLKADLGTFVNAHSSYGPTVFACPPPFNAQFVSSTNTGTSYWDFGDGNNSSQNTITHSYSNTGTYNVLLLVTDTNTCNRTDSVKSLMNIINPTDFDLGENAFICFNTKTLLKPNISASSYTWSTGQHLQSIYVNQPGVYTLSITNQGGCVTSDEINVLYGTDKLHGIFPNIITPNGDGRNDEISFKKLNIGEMEFILFDRWGKERIRINDIEENFSAKGLDDGTYYYVINFLSSCTGKHATDKGYITVMR